MTNLIPGLNNYMNTFKNFPPYIASYNKKEYVKTLELQQNFIKKVCNIISTQEENNALLIDQLSAEKSKFSELDILQKEQKAKLEDLEKKFNDEKESTESRIKKLENENGELKTHLNIFISHFKPIIKSNYAVHNSGARVARGFDVKEAKALLSELKNHEKLWLQLAV